MIVKLFDSIHAAVDLLEDRSPARFIYGSKEYVVLRIGECIYAFENACPHLREKLHLGHVTHSGQIVCPLHSYQFSLNNGEEVQQRCKPLRIFEGKKLLKSGEIYIEI